MRPARRAAFGHGVDALPMTAPPSRARHAARNGGFTLLELLVVVSIMALATAGVRLALRDSQQTLLEREAQRLAALLETARTRSRILGTPVQWRLTDNGFTFDGLPSGALPGQWLSPGTTVTAPATPLLLGPEPLIGRQQVTLVRADLPGASLRVGTDGLRPFAVQPQEP